MQHREMQNISDPLASCSVTWSPPETDPYHPGHIRMTLENSDLWKSFNSVGTEMIITKHGRRMFPHCNISLSGLQPYAKYVIMVEMVPVDNFRYKWSGERWEVGKADPQPPSRTYTHPDSPAPGSHWMKQSVSFLKIKLTNHTLDQHGHIILSSMHRYYPRFHVLQADRAFMSGWGNPQSFSFPETSFTAVTSYQNTKIIRLKIDHNPFAKGFREEGSHTQIKRCGTRKSPKNAAKKAKADRDAAYNSPPDLQRTFHDYEPGQDRLSLEPPEEGSAKGYYDSPWAVDQDLPQTAHTDPLDIHAQDYGSEEQMVPASIHQPYRSVGYRLPSPSSVGDWEGGQDVATVPGYYVTRPELAREMGCPQNRHATQAMPGQNRHATQAMLGQNRPATQAMPGQNRPATQAMPGQNRPATQAMPGQNRPATQAMLGQNRPSTQAMPGQNLPATQAMLGQNRPANQAMPGQNRHATQAMPGQNYRVTVSISMPSKPSPGIMGYRHPLYGHHTTDQTLGQWADTGAAGHPFPHHHHPLTTAEHDGHQHGYHHGNTVEWSQRPNPFSWLVNHDFGQW